MTEQTQSTEGATRRRRATKKTPAKKTTAKKTGNGTSEAEAIAAAAAAEKKARAAAKEAERLAKKAKADAAKAKAKAKKDKEKAAAKAKAEKFKEATLKGLEKDAKDINSRFASIERGEKRVDDQRLAAAIIINTAKDKCREAKINFKNWCESHLQLPPREEGGEPRKLSYESVRKLQPIGAAEAEEEGAGLLMLEDMRAANKEANKQARARKKAKAQPKKATVEDAQKVVDDLEKDEWTEFMETQAKVGGFRLVDQEDEGEGEEDAKMTALDRAKAAFGRLRAAKSKKEFAEWVCDQMGWASGVFPDEEDNGEEGTEAVGADEESE